MPEWSMLVVQATCAVMTLEQLRRRVFPALDSLPQPEILLDVWGPLTLIMPMLFLVGLVENSVGGSGWIAIGGPVMCGVLALGAALIVNAGHSAPDARRSDRSATRLLITLAGAGLLLLMLGLAYDLTLWMGQCALMLAAVLLWINTPDDAPPPRDSTAPQMRAGIGMALALAGSIGQGVAAVLTPNEFQPISGGMMIAFAAMALASGARVAGSAAAVRLGGWGAAYGVLLGLGLLSLVRLVPAAIEILHDREAPLVHRVAFGFGHYAIEGLLLLGIAGAVLAWPKLPFRFMRLAGIIIIALAATLAAWRLTPI